MYDMNSKQLVELIEANWGAFKASRYYKVFDGFDGSTGFDLPEKLNKLDSKLVNHINIDVEMLKRRFG